MNSVLAVIFFAIIFLIPIVSADIGPKPSVDFQITFNKEKISDAEFYAQMLSCVDEKTLQQVVRNITFTTYSSTYIASETQVPQLNISEFDSTKNCYWYPSRFAWGGDCKDSKCSFDYNPPRDFKLAVFLPSINRTFISNEANLNNFHSTYDTNILPNGKIEMKETTSFLMSDASKQIENFALALILTLVIELLVGLIYINWNKINKKRYLEKRKAILLTILSANLISLPIVWFLFPPIGLGVTITILFAEFFAIVFEGIFIYSFNKKIFKIKDSMILSLIMNVVSLFVGGFLYLIFAFIFGFI